MKFHWFFSGTEWNLKANITGKEIDLLLLVYKHTTVPVNFLCGKVVYK